MGQCSVPRAHLSALDRSRQLDASFSRWAPLALAVLCLSCALEESERWVAAAGYSTLRPTEEDAHIGMGGACRLRIDFGGRLHGCPTGDNVTI
jgi:hypothetical protein